MSEESFHRDAARLARIQAKLSESKGDKDRARRWRQNAHWHDIEGDKSRDIDIHEEILVSAIMLMAREALINGWTVGYLTDESEWNSTVIISHPFCGVLQWKISTRHIPAWLGFYPNIPEAYDMDTREKRIAKYLYHA